MPTMKTSAPLPRRQPPLRGAILSMGMALVMPALAWAAGAPAADEAAVRAEYDRMAMLYAAKPDYLIRHILVETKAEADRALARIRAGEAFAQVARELSRDPGSSQAGGDLGWSQPHFFVTPFAREVVRLAPKGLVAEPVQTRFGWHVIEVMGQRPQQDFPTYETLHDRLVNYVAGLPPPQSATPGTHGPTTLWCRRQDYPQPARVDRETGTTRVRYRIGANGRVIKSEVLASSGSPPLDDASMSLAESCVFSPAAENGKAVEVTAEIDYVWKPEP